MYAIDFEYDGKCLSDYGFIICSFDSMSGSYQVSAGSNITFNTVSLNHGKRHNLQSTSYDECIQAVFQICKNPCDNESLSITSEEFRDLMRWLNRREFLKFGVIYTEEDDFCYYDGSFNVEKILVGGDLVGLQLTLTTDRPFGYGEDYVIKWSFYDGNLAFSFVDISDEIGFIYPDMEITVKQSGNLVISNEFTDSNLRINNCRTGEVIKIKGEPMIITSSLPSHELFNDFNFDFIKIGNTYSDRKNTLTSNLNCDVVLSYKPIIKNSPH